jgi:small Trp-rich protein
MAFIIAGCLLLAMKVAEIGFAADWPWWGVLLPFGLAVVWWAISDSLGLTQKREIQKMEDRKQERRRRSMEALGMDWRRDKRVAVIRNQARGSPPWPSPRPKPRPRRNKASRAKHGDNTAEVSRSNSAANTPATRRDGH